MVEGCAGKSLCIVTYGAVHIGWNMDLRLACRLLPIVTGSAVVINTRMIKHRIGKTAGYVTDTAIFGRRNMIVMLSCR